MSENMGASTSCNPKGLHGLYRDNFTDPYPEPDESNPNAATNFLKIHFNTAFPSTPRSSKSSQPFKLSELTLLIIHH
jgi:hypothetical protein